MIEAGTKHLSVETLLPERDGKRWMEQAAAMREVLERRLLDDGLVPTEAPPMPMRGVEGYIDGAFRVICVYDLSPIIGVEDYPDVDGDPIYIYGDPAWRVRVDTLARPKD